MDRAEPAIGTNFAFDLCSDSYRAGQLTDVDPSSVAEQPLANDELTG